MEDIDLCIGWVAGAILKGDYLDAMRSAGFENIEVITESAFSAEAVGVGEEDPGLGSIRSITVRASKPRDAAG